MFTCPSKFTAVALACATALSPLPALAQGLNVELIDVGLIEDVGGSARINMSGKLRMLSQRIPAAACNEAAYIALDISVPMLADAVAEFDRIIAALEYGDDELGIYGPETNRKVLADIQALHDIWDPLHVDLDAMIAGDITHEHALKIEVKSDALLTVAKHMVSLISGRYADPAALLQADALTIDIAGRQRMLAQRMSKDACMIASGDLTDVARAELVEAMSMFDTSLMALRMGMSAAGIVPPPNEAVQTQLDTVAADWAQMSPMLQSLLDGKMPSEEERARIFNGLNTLTGKMNTAVGYYSDASKQGL